MKEKEQIELGKQRLVMLIIAALIWVLALCFSGCKTCEPIIETIEKERIVEVHTRDTAIVTQADSAQVRALLRCDSAYNVILEELVTMQGERIETELQMEKMQGGGVVLKMDCKEDSLLTEIQLRDSIITNMEKKTVVVREKYVPDYYKNTSVGFWVLFALIVIYIVIRILIRIYLKK